MRRLLLPWCVLLVLACKLGGTIEVDNSIAQLMAGPTPLVGDVKVEPQSGRRNTLIPVTFKGKFALETWVVTGTGITASAVNQPNDSEIQAAITIAGDAPFGQQFLTLTNSRGQQLTATFTVLQAGAPTITKVEPRILGQDTTTLVTITGTNFGSPLSQAVISGSDVLAFGSTVIDANTMTAYIKVDPGGTPGTRAFEVFNGLLEKSEEYSVLVVPPDQVPYSGPAHTLTSVVPATLEAGQTTTVTLKGTNFQPKASVVLDGIRSDHQVSGYKWIDSTTAQANIQIVSTAAAGTRNIRIGITSEDVSNTFPVQIVQPVTPARAVISFRASEPLIYRGNSSTLSWTITTSPDNTIALECSLFSGADKIADVPCRSGERVVSPTNNTEYKLTVRGNNLSDWAVTTVAVGTAPPSTTPPVTTTPPASSNSQTFSTTGTHSFTVPAGVTQVTLEVDGGSGGSGGNNGGGSASGGRGGRVTANVAVTAGETLTVVVGVTGSNGSTSAMGFGGNGTGVGANGGIAASGAGGGGGGGGSSVSRGGTVLVLAGGGGGGGGSDATTIGGAGGAGGGAAAAANGTNASTAVGGSGASQAAAGSGGFGLAASGTAGSGRDGGAGANNVGIAGGGGGGGGGAFGGGGGGAGTSVSLPAPGAGGGGGSSSVIGSATSVTHTQGGATTTSALVVIRW